MAKLGMFFKTLGTKITTLWKTTLWFKIASIGGTVVIATSAVVIPNAIISETGGIFHKCNYSVENIDTAYSHSVATCTDKAKYYYSCACGEKGTKLFEYGNALGHTDGEWITDKEANCTEDGSKHQVCAVCDATIKTKTLTKLGHTDGQWITDKEANCTEDGSKHQVCAVCDATIKTETLTKLGHTDGQWITDKEANCTEDGSKHQVCAVCDATNKTKTLTKLGHTDGEWITDKEANCTEDGSKHQICSVCEATIKTETLTKFGHSYKENLPDTACVGTDIVYQCNNCEDTYTKKLQAISADIKYCYWSYNNGSNCYVQDLVSFNGIQGGYGKYTITITYTDPRGESHGYKYTVDNLHGTKYLGDASWDVYFRQYYPPFATIEIEDELALKTIYTVYFPTLGASDYNSGENYYPQNTTINVSTTTVEHSGLYVTSYSDEKNYFARWYCSKCDVEYVTPLKPIEATFALTKITYTSYTNGYEFTWKVHPSGGIGSYEYFFMVTSLSTGEFLGQSDWQSDNEFTFKSGFRDSTSTLQTPIIVWVYIRDTSGGSVAYRFEMTTINNISNVHIYSSYSPGR